MADQFIKPLELWYPPLLDISTLKDVKWVVVLGGGHTSSPELPAECPSLDNSSLSRLVEGIRIHRELPGSKLLLSGGAVFDPVPEAVTMAAVARMLGVSPETWCWKVGPRTPGSSPDSFRRSSRMTGVSW